MMIIVAYGQDRSQMLLSGIVSISASFAGLQFFAISCAVFVTTAAVIITDAEVRGTIFRRRKVTRQ